jgi:hypothetical protein
MCPHVQLRQPEDAPGRHTASRPIARVCRRNTERHEGYRQLPIERTRCAD